MPASPLLARLATLERTVGQLVGAVGAGTEAAVPNTYQVDANGNIVVQGIVLPNGNGASPLPTSRIRWVPNTGGVVAEIFGFLNAGTQSLSLDVDPDGGNLALIQLNAKANGALGTAGIGIAAVDSSGGNSSKTLIDSAGHSHFVQDNAGRNFRLDGGSGTLTWGGVSASATTNIVGTSFTTFAGLIVSISTISALGNIQLQGAYNAGNPANFTVTGISFSGVPGAGTTLTFYYLAFGF